MTEQSKKRHKSSFSALCLYTLLIELHPDEIRPAIWRRLVVDGRVSLAKLHHFIQAAFGWTDAHLHTFTINEIRYMEPYIEKMLYDIEHAMSARAISIACWLTEIPLSTSTTSATADLTTLPSKRSKWSRMIRTAMLMSPGVNEPVRPRTWVAVPATTGFWKPFWATLISKRPGDC